MGEPLSAGTVHESATCAFPAVADSTGAAGTARGTAFTAVLYALYPAAFCARTWKPYVVPFVSPVTVAVFVAGVLCCIHAPAPILYSTSYAVIAAPLFAGTGQVNTTCVFPAVAVTTGAAGTVLGTAFTVVLYALNPMALCDLIRKL